ncbi:MULTISPECIES: transcriptional regulator GcvA [Pseudoalteromonas]|jgi:LysR family glycine cleavage system transcriptional activator|uniref:Transcriptional regulator n=6 Tax=Pseudoalteromonas TaxID=53246 RepID=A0AAD0TZV8_9GAMM|nr:MULTISPECIES: transcriptional regulator GcvA [Pseudoalteromonas]MAJ39970.1 transcriptional regulator GcvA [Pseudoalteromonadaceae bacterium]MDC9522129.1 transcriptional regulator GcvA [Pseudoalteromonas sp. Angola-31]OUX89176.1 MAG: transcriptional regulator GcvA [Pseudoalteromonas sp. TMED43]HAG40102.1 transcriptional regulator GcvA [Pseudoalteromonas sp.]ASM50533.1 LysR family transcriptional regulator, glycine cleavage system transcriptional activator [Pseudoalteromonas espejiana DSM 941|tara:strand:- start:299 stop:1195 length:897 start_codon:yes stop_codon:yes gene_type:complete
MSRRVPPLNALKAFEAAARHLSFTKAAEELYVTQAAVSHQIKTLEEHLGLKLFLRKNRSLLLTEEGQGYFLDIKEIFTQLIDATEKLLARGAKGSLTVSLTPSFAIQWLVPRLSLFNELHPEIDVRIKAQDQDENSLTDDVDIAIYYGRGHWSGVQTYKLHTEYLVPLCSPLLLSGHKPLNQPSDLAQHTLLHDTTRRNWKTWMKTAGVRNVQVNQGPIFSHSSMVLQAAVHGQGVAIGNSVLAKPDIDAGRLVIPFSHSLESKNAYYLVIRESQTELGKIVSFKDWMLSLVEQEQEY